MARRPGIQAWTELGAVAAAPLLVVIWRIGVPRSLLLAGAVGACVLIVLVRLPPGRGALVGMAVVGFLAATPSLAKGKLQFSDVGLAAVLAVLVVKPPVRAGDGARRDPKPLVIGLAIVLVGGLFGTFFAPARAPFTIAASYQGSGFGFLPERVADALRFGVFTIGIVLLVRLWRPTSREVRTVLVAYGLGVIASSIDAIIVGGTQGQRAVGFTTHPVFFGFIAAMGTVIGIGLAMAGRPTRLVGLATLAAGVYGVLESGTRSSLLIAALGALVFLVASRSFRSVVQFCVVAVLALLITLTVGAVTESPTVTRLTTQGVAATSDQTRTLLRNETFAFVKTHGLTGAGFRYLIQPHNLVLGVIATAGVIGVAGALVVIVTLASWLATTRRDPIVLAVLAAALGVYGNSWVVNAGWDRWLWLPIALAASAPLQMRERSRPASPRVPAAV